MSEISKGLNSGRKGFLGGSDSLTIMGTDLTALHRLWREKRGEAEPEDLSGNLTVQLGKVTEDLNRRWFETNSGHQVIDVQKHVRHPALHWMGATLDGRVEATGAVFEAKFMLPWSFSEQAAVEKYAPQLQHNLWIVAGRTAVLSVITGGGKWVENRGPGGSALPASHRHRGDGSSGGVSRAASPLPSSAVEPPKPRIAAVRIVDMSTSNAWAEFAGTFTRTHPAFLEHERAKAELKSLVPEDAQQAIGHGVRAKRSKSGAITFELLNAEDGHAAV